MVVIHKCISAQSIGKAHLSQMETCSRTNWNERQKTPLPSVLPPAGLLLLLFCSFFPPSFHLFLTFFNSHFMQSHYPSSGLPPSSLCLSLSIVLSLHVFPFLPYLFSLCLTPSVLSSQSFYSHSVHLSLCFSLCLSPLVVNQSWLGAERAERSSPVDQCL